MTFHLFQFLKKLLIPIIIIFLTYTNTFSHVDHYSNFKKIEYDLYRNNNLIGFHTFDFLRNNENLTVKSHVEFKISKLGIDLYRYKAISEENYKNMNFHSFKSQTNQNKKEKYVNISLDEFKNELIIDGSSYKGPASKEYIVGTWWNHEIVKAKAQISAISGRIIEQKVTFIGKETININGKDYQTLHFNFASSDETLPKEKKLNTDIWYDEKSLLWVKASFDKTGYWEYRIKKFE